MSRFGGRVCLRCQLKVFEFGTAPWRDRSSSGGGNLGTGEQNKVRKKRKKTPRFDWEVQA